MQICFPPCIILDLLPPSCDKSWAIATSIHLYILSTLCFAIATMGYNNLTAMEISPSAQKLTPSIPPPTSPKIQLVNILGLQDLELTIGCIAFTFTTS